MRRGQHRPQEPTKEVLAWAEEQRRILAEDRQDPRFVQRLQAMQEQPNGVRTA